MGWLDDLLGDAQAGAPDPYVVNPNDWQNSADFSQVLPNWDQLYSGGVNLANTMFGEQELPANTGIMDLYHGAMQPLGAPKKIADILAGTLGERAGIPVGGENESGALMYELLKAHSPEFQGLQTVSGMGGFDPFFKRASQNALGMVADPTTYALPNAPGILFAPGMAEQAVTGIQKGGQEGYADALIAALGLGAIGSHYVPEGGLGKAGAALKDVVYPETTLGREAGVLKFPPRPEVEVYSGGDGTFWSTNPERAASYGEVKKVTVPADVFESGQKLASDLGQPTKWDTVLPDEWVKKAEPAPEIKPKAYEVTDTGQSIQDILAELEAPKEATLPGRAPVPLERPSVEQMKLGDIEPFKEYERTAEGVGVDKWQALLDSIKEEGIKEPLTIDMVEGKPKLAEGNTRLAIAKELGLETVPVEGLTENLEFVKPSELLAKPESIVTPEKIETVPEEIKATPKEQLSELVSSMKEKYGEKSWRKEMTPEERTSFEATQLEAVKTPTGIKPIEPIEAKPPTPIEPPTKPPELLPPGEPPIPKVPGGKLESLSIWERTFLPTLRNLAKTSPKIGKRIKAYDTFHAVEASKHIADIRETTQGLGKESSQKIIQFLDGEKVGLNAPERAAATRLRGVLDTIAEQAESNNVLVGYRKGYFPRKYGDKFEFESSPRAFGTKNKPLGHLEKSRQRDRGDFRRDFKVLEEYANEATRRIAEAKYLGKNLERVTGKKFKGDQPTAEYVEKAISRVTGRERSTVPSRAADKLRKITALGDLAFASISQVGQAAHTASVVGLRRTVRAAFQTLKQFPKEQLDAVRSGALWPSISHEVSKAVGDKGYMHGIATVDKAMRVHANVAGKLLAQDALKGSKYAQRQLESLGVKLNDPELSLKAGRAIADKTQFRTGTLDLPLWSQSPLGKLATQYSSFAYSHARFVHDMFRHPVRNLGQIARFAGIGLLAGEVVGDVKEAIRAIVPGKNEDDDVLRRMLEAVIGDEKFDEQEWLKKLQLATRSKRIPISSPGWRAIQNLSMVGGLGVFQSVLEKAASGKFWQLPIGPAGSLLVDTGEALRGDIEKGVGKGDWSMGGSLKNLLINAPLPLVSGRKLADLAFPEKKKKKRRKS